MSTKKQPFGNGTRPGSLATADAQPASAGYSLRDRDSGLRREAQMRGSSDSNQRKAGLVCALSSREEKTAAYFEIGPGPGGCASYAAFFKLAIEFVHRKVACSEYPHPPRQMPHLSRVRAFGRSQRIALEPEAETASINLKVPAAAHGVRAARLLRLLPRSHLQ